MIKLNEIFWCYGRCFGQRRWKIVKNPWKNEMPYLLIRDHDHLKDGEMDEYDVRNIKFRGYTIDECYDYAWFVTRL